LESQPQAQTLKKGRVFSSARETMALLLITSFPAFMGFGGYQD
jgi:hypothetical protein